MKLPTLKFILLLTLAVTSLHAADGAHPKRVTSILEVETIDAAAYIERIARFNRAVKDKVKKDAYIRVFQTTFDSRKSGRLRVVTDAPTIAELTKNAELLEAEVRSLQRELDPTRSMGARMLYQALRVDGSSSKGGANYTTSIAVTDEKGYLAALQSLWTILDENGMKDIRISLYRAIAGRADHTHLVILGAGSMTRLGEFLDFVATSEKAAAWIAGSANHRTVVNNFVAKEITK